MYLSTSDMSLCWEDTNFRFRFLGRVGRELCEPDHLTDSAQLQIPGADVTRCHSDGKKTEWVSRCSERNDSDCTCNW